MTRRSFQPNFNIRKSRDQKFFRNLFNKFKRIEGVADNLAENVRFSRSVIAEQNVQVVEGIVNCSP